MSHKSAAATSPFANLDGIPPTDINVNLRAALAAGRWVTEVVREAAALRYGPTKVAPQV